MQEQERGVSLRWSLAPSRFRPPAEMYPHRVEDVLSGFARIRGRKARRERDNGTRGRQTMKFLRCSRPARRMQFVAENNDRRLRGDEQNEGVWQIVRAEHAVPSCLEQLAKVR